MAVEWAPVGLVRGWPIAAPDGSWGPQREEVSLPGAAVIVADEFGAILESYSIEGHWFGDIHVESVRVAKEIAAEDWDVQPAAWEAVAAVVDDYAAYVVAAARRRLSS